MQGVAFDRRPTDAAGCLGRKAVGVRQEVGQVFGEVVEGRTIAKTAQKWPHARVVLIHMANTLLPGSASEGTLFTAKPAVHVEMEMHQVRFVRDEFHETLATGVIELCPVLADSS